MAAFDPPVIDNFTGSNGSIDNRVSSSGAVWAAPAITGDSAASITSNAIPTGTVGIYYQGVIDSQQYGPDIQIATTYTQITSSNCHLLVFADGFSAFPSSSTVGNAYWLVVGTGGGGAPASYILTRRITTTSTELINMSSPTNWNAPESLGLSISTEGGGQRLSIQRKIAGVWTEEANVLDTAGTRPSGLKYLGFSVEAVSGSIIMDDFMGQSVVAGPTAIRQTTPPARFGPF